MVFFYKKNFQQCSDKALSDKAVYRTFLRTQPPSAKVWIHFFKQKSNYVFFGEMYCFIVSDRQIDGFRAEALWVEPGGGGGVGQRGLRPHTQRLPGQTNSRRKSKATHPKNKNFQFLLRKQEGSPFPYSTFPFSVSPPPPLFFGRKVPILFCSR